MKTFIFTVLVGVISGCVNPTAYNKLAWAKMPLEQAVAVCNSTVQANPLISHNACMEANGWKAVY